MFRTVPIINVFPIVDDRTSGVVFIAANNDEESPDFSWRAFRSKRRAFKWAARAGQLLGVPVRNFHMMTSRQRKAYWRRVVEAAE